MEGNEDSGSPVLLSEMINLPTARKVSGLTIKISGSVFIRSYIVREFVIFTLHRILLG
jgi:hypothetical protein